MEEPAPPASGTVCINHRRHLYSRCCSVKKLNPLPNAPPVPTPWDAYTAAAVVQGACTPSSVVCSDPRDAHPVSTTCHCFSMRGLDPFPSPSSLTIPRGAFRADAAVRCIRHLAAKVVCTDAAGRSFLFTTSRHLIGRNRDRLPLVSSVSTARDAYAVAAGVRGACTPLGYCLFRPSRRLPSQPATD